MKKIYLKPTLEVFQMKTTHSLLAGSLTDNTGSAADMGSGSFGAPEFDFEYEAY